MHEPFSLLVSVYDGDRPDYIRRALRSAVDEQTVRPDQVVIVRDGPVRDEIARCLDEFRRTSPVPVSYIPLPSNGGLGPALDEGLTASWFDVVARMDADDVAMPYRFEVELPLIQDADIVGAGLLEFVADTDDIVGQRVPPTEPGQIQRYARMHDPFNHPTIVYRRHAVLAAGGYGEFPLMEDYALFARMLAGGARAVNVAEPLVFYRVGSEAFKRRGGTRLLRSELRLQREFRRRGFTTPLEFVRNVLVRGGYRLIPWWCRRAVYRPIVAHFSELGELEPAAAAPQQPANGRPADARSADCRPADCRLADCRLADCRMAAEREYPEMPAAGYWREQPLPVGS
jgi:glycosyltransferase involved in cell wall biosynthesis